MLVKPFGKLTDVISLPYEYQGILLAIELVKEKSFIAPLPVIVSTCVVLLYDHVRLSPQMPLSSANAMLMLANIANKKAKSFFIVVNVLWG